MACNRQDLLAEPFLHSVSDTRGQRRLELGSCCRERLDLVAGPFERGVDLRRLAAAFCRGLEPCLRARDCFGVHRRRRYRDGRMDVSELDYELPQELIAQHPTAQRDDSRLLVYDRANGAIRHRRFSELPEELHGERVVVNDTKVVPARIPSESPRGEVLLLERIDGDVWEAFARQRRSITPGQRQGEAELIELLVAGRSRLCFDGEPPDA